MKLNGVGRVMREGDGVDRSSTPQPPKSISPLHAYHTDCADSTTTTPGHVPPCCESVNSPGRRQFTQSARPLRIGRKAPEYTAESH